MRLSRTQIVISGVRLGLLRLLSICAVDDLYFHHTVDIVDRVLLLMKIGLLCLTEGRSQSFFDRATPRIDYQGRLTLDFFGFILAFLPLRRRLIHHSLLRMIPRGRTLCCYSCVKQVVLLFHLHQRSLVHFLAIDPS